MVNVHVADCQLGDRVTIANNTILGALSRQSHVTIGGSESTHS
jgi:acyl-[acyl carrier protein]--UDP-N-acetylglucosamine O-acyltransferase